MQWQRGAAALVGAGSCSPVARTPPKHVRPTCKNTVKHPCSKALRARASICNVLLPSLHCGTSTGRTARYVHAESTELPRAHRHASVRSAPLPHHEPYSCIWFSSSFLKVALMCTHTSLRSSHALRSACVAVSSPVQQQTAG